MVPPLPNEELRMLSVWQPWASLLVADEELVALIEAVNPELAAHLPKDVENRPYGTAWKGTLLVHAAKTRIDETAMKLFKLNPDWFVRGAVVGVVRLLDVVDRTASWWAQGGSRHWMVDAPVRLRTPVECRGHQGLRAPTPAVAAAVLTQLVHQAATGPAQPGDMVAVAQR